MLTAKYDLLDRLRSLSPEDNPIIVRVVSENEVKGFEENAVITGGPPGELPAGTEEKPTDRSQKRAGQIALLPASPECTPEPSNARGTPCQSLSRFTAGCVVCESGHAGEVDMDLANGSSARVTSLRRNFALYNVNAHLDHFNKPAEPKDKSIIVGVKNPWPKVI
jgi:hypothetical protein